MTTMARGLLASALLAAMLLVAGCGGGGAKPGAKAGPDAPSEPIRVEAARWLPGENDTVFAYKTEDLVAKTKGVFMLKVRRIGADRVDLIGPKRTEHLVYKADGIVREMEATYLLRTPVQTGLTWPGGPNASNKIGRTGFAVKVEAGEFDRCIEVIETRTGGIQGTITTTFCADVGIVSIETRGQSGDAEVHERVELRSFQKAVDLGPPGVTKTQVNPQ